MNIFDVADVVAPFSLLDKGQLHYLQAKAIELVMNGVKGDFVECGVCHGGSTSALAHAAKRFGRKVWAFDVFTGLPKPEPIDRYNEGRSAIDDGLQGQMAASPDSVKRLCEQLGCADAVVVCPGLFKDTLPNLKAEIALLHADADLHSSTNDILYNLAHLVVPGGLIRIDDYWDWEGCRKACDDFFDDHKEFIEFDKVESLDEFWMMRV